MADKPVDKDVLDKNVLELNKRISTQIVAAQCQGVSLPDDAERSINEHFTKDFVVRGNFPGLEAKGTKEWNAAIREAIPDYNVTVDDQVAENDRVVTRWTARGTHKGTFQGIAPTGKQVVVSGMTISRYVKGKVAESWVELDTANLLRQLGASPSDGPRQLGLGAGGVTLNITINK
jgi:steroid delta-isomerase-like uncharacterized protein